MPTHESPPRDFVADAVKRFAGVYDEAMRYCCVQAVSTKSMV